MRGPTLAWAFISALAFRSRSRFAISLIMSPPPDGGAGDGAAAEAADLVLGADASSSSVCT